MQTKLFEVRDRATAIPCFGIKMVPSGVEDGNINEDERFLLRRAGYGFDLPLVLFGRLEGGEVLYDPYGWSQRSRTMHEAHQYVTMNWDKLDTGAVIDIEFIKHETNEPKVSERFYQGHRS